MVTAGLVGCPVGLARNTLGLLEVEFFFTDQDAPPPRRLTNNIKALKACAYITDSCSSTQPGHPSDDRLIEWEGKP